MGVMILFTAVLLCASPSAPARLPLKALVLYENGLSVTTTLDPKLQELANKALEHGLRAYDKRHGWRKPTRNVIAEKHTIDGFKDERWNRPMVVGDVVPAVVVTAPKSGAGK